jgi:hypothetical protein
LQFELSLKLIDGLELQAHTYKESDLYIGQGDGVFGQHLEVKFRYGGDQVHDEMEVNEVA